MTIFIVWNRAWARPERISPGAFSAVGLFVMPSMLYAFAGLALLALAVIWSRWRELLPWGAFTALVATPLCLPVLMFNRGFATMLGVSLVTPALAWVS